VDHAGAERVVPDLAVAHVLVAGQADRGAVGAQRDELAGAEQAIERGRARQLHRVGGVAGAEADAVEDRQHQRAAGAGPGRMRAQDQIGRHRRETLAREVPAPVSLLQR
jgi:hypothetical protein